MTRLPFEVLVLVRRRDEILRCTRDEAVELLHWPEPKELLRNL